MNLNPGRWIEANGTRFRETLQESRFALTIPAFASPPSRCRLSTIYCAQSASARATLAPCTLAQYRTHVRDRAHRGWRAGTERPFEPLGLDDRGMDHRVPIYYISLTLQRIDQWRREETFDGSTASPPGPMLWG